MSLCTVAANWVIITLKNLLAPSNVVRGEGAEAEWRCELWFLWTWESKTLKSVRLRVSKWAFAKALVRVKNCPCGLGLRRVSFNTYGGQMFSHSVPRNIRETFSFPIGNTHTQTYTWKMNNKLDSNRSGDRRLSLGNRQFANTILSHFIIAQSY